MCWTTIHTLNALYSCVCLFQKDSLQWRRKLSNNRSINNLNYNYSSYEEYLKCCNYLPHPQEPIETFTWKIFWMSFIYSDNSIHASSVSRPHLPQLHSLIPPSTPTRPLSPSFTLFFCFQKPLHPTRASWNVDPSLWLDLVQVTMAAVRSWVWQPCRLRTSLYSTCPQLLALMFFPSSLPWGSLDLGQGGTGRGQGCGCPI